ncbi:hypothetical protein DIPPA_29371 [Diplonema papillatum]|nr:hypothetical protein DIPPA_29371 [Diplonema papillatum]
MSGAGPWHELVVSVEEWKGPSLPDMYCTVSLNRMHESFGKGVSCSTGCTWASHDKVMFAFDDDMQAEEHILEFRVVEGNTLGDKVIGKSISKLDEYTNLFEGGPRQYAPVLSIDETLAGTLVGTLKVKLQVVEGQHAAFAPSAPPLPSAPSLPSSSSSAPPPPANAYTATPPTQIMDNVQPAQLQHNPYASSLPSMSAPSAPNTAAYSSQQTQIPCRIVENAQGPLRYAGDPPIPPAPITDKTPTEEWNEYVEKSRLDLKASDSDYKKTHTKPTAQPQKKEGFMGKLKAGVSSAVHHTTNFVKDATLSTEIAVRKADEDSARKKWEQAFGQVAKNNQMHADFKCKFVNGKGQSVEGSIFIAQHHFAFVPNHPPSNSSSQTQLAAPQQPPFYEQFSNVVTYQVAQSLGHSCIQIYTNTGYVFQFGHFLSDFKRQIGSLWGTVKTTPFKSFLNYFDHQWRANTTVPVPGFRYL